MDTFAFETFDEDNATIYNATKQLDLLVGLHDRIAVEGICKDDAILLNRIDPTILQGINVNSFTMRPSATKAGVAAEAIDWRKTGLIAASITALLLFIGKIISWLMNASKLTAERTGTIKQIDKLNKEIASLDLNAERVTKEDVAKLEKKHGLKLYEKYVNNRVVDVRTIYDLMMRFDAGNLKDRAGKEVTLRDVTDAVAAYAVTCAKINKGKDPLFTNKLLSTMLKAPNGAVPAVIRRMDWTGGVKGEIMRPGHIKNALALMKAAGDILTLTNQYIPLIKEATAKTVPVILNDSKTIAIAIKIEDRGGKHIWDGVHRIRDNVTAILQKTAPANSSEAVIAFEDVYDTDGNICHLAIDAKAAIDAIKEEKDAWLSFWKGSYQDHPAKSLPGAASQLKLIEGLASKRGREELAEFYGSMYDLESKSVKSKLAIEGARVNELLATAKEQGKLLADVIRSPEHGWSVAIMGHHDVDNDAITEATTVHAEMQQTIKIAQAIVYHTSEITSAGMILCNAANYCVNLTARVK